LTISDACSRYLLRCQAVEKMDYARVRAIFESAFRECGLPGAIRTDNGAPFASRAIAGLSRLAVWWMKLGIVPERIAAGHPEQNGRHERMHRTLKQETASPAAANRRAQQRGSIDFGGSTTKNVRTKRWAWKLPVRCTRRRRGLIRRGLIRRGCRSRNTAARCKCGGCGIEAIFPGSISMCF
jgi:transposase InsO family protein